MSLSARAPDGAETFCPSSASPRSWGFTFLCSVILIESAFYAIVWPRLLLFFAAVIGTVSALLALWFKLTPAHALPPPLSPVSAVASLRSAGPSALSQALFCLGPGLFLAGTFWVLYHHPWLPPCFFGTLYGFGAVLGTLGGLPSTRQAPAYHSGILAGVLIGCCLSQRDDPADT